MRLKLDLHPIFSDSRRIEEALQEVVEEAVAKRATEVEIIPGKGSGALKKTVLRFLERPEIKAQYHRIEKDSDNWGRLFIHFRHERAEPAARKLAATEPALPVPCACCTQPMSVPAPEDEADSAQIECPWCGSPHRVTFRRDRRGTVHATARLDYGDV